MTRRIAPWALGLTTLALGGVVAIDYFAAGNNTTFRFSEWRSAISWGHMAVGVLVVVASQFSSSPYGRHAPVDKNDTSVTLPASMSWMIQESPTLAAFLFFNWKYDGAAIKANPASLLFAAHYVNRTLIWPMVLGQGTPQRVWVTMSALFYCLFNGYLQNGVDASTKAVVVTVGSAGGLELTLPLIGKLAIQTPILAAAGAALFGFGMWANITADRHLVSLKQENKGYQVPRHWLFEKISCPNFFYEAVEWFGFTVCTAGCCGVSSPYTVAALSFFVFTMSNTFPRAVQHHQWYRQKFENYDNLNRKAVIPYVL